MTSSQRRVSRQLALIVLAVPADGGTLGVNALKDDKMIPAEVCARRIVEGIE